MSTLNKKEVISQAKQEIANSVAYKRLAALFDDGTFTEIDAFVKSSDSYAEVVAGYGAVNGCPAYAFAQNSDFAGGAMSKAQASKLEKIYDLAVKTGSPVIGLYDSNGARMNEGVDMLGGYGKILNSISNLSGVVPQLSVILGNCFGAGALNAANADVIIMSKDAKFTVATNGTGGGSDEAYECGLVDAVAESEAEAIEKARELITYLPSNNLSMAPIADSADAEAVSGDDPIALTVDAGTFFELKAGSGKNAKVGFARICGSTAAVVSTNGEELDCKDCKKIADFVNLCDSFAIPVVTFANSKGFKCLKSASKLAAVYAQATTVKATVVTGEAYGPFYVAVAGTGANADVTFAWADASIAPLPPVTGANILWADKMAVPVSQQQAVIDEFKATQCSAFAAAAKGYVEDIINPENTRAKLFAALDMLAGKRVSTLPKKHSTI
ncbi:MULTISPECIES: carboxyl transferase domain-containing protein [unclassified Ruminococcus]|uniref:carboxyl transferase domain-containing protein n=1 Tax=unclassified Ruminococcus TaxID=2608920 RepID=UPI00210B41CF|nr:MULTISPECIES: carboxyl transferase domain-containing protein [unclassified Ruminococcus]MCQ4022612.1 carboxyl transferase [Ruminococcus sp. zg-924]MCQ4114852.1 carboxyl transferase [Ruminococcus sp. zg-921]